MYPTSEPATQAGRPLSSYQCAQSSQCAPMPRKTRPVDSNAEGRILLAIQALDKGQFNSLRSAIKAYDAPRTTVQVWRNEKKAR